MNKPHKHAECIKAWADGAEIESRFGIMDEWELVSYPSWSISNQYRIKPQPVIKKMYMHYDSIERYVKNNTSNGHEVPQTMYSSDSAMSDHIEFTFTDDKLTSVEIKKVKS